MVYLVLGIELRALCRLGKPSTGSDMFTSIFIFFKLQLCRDYISFIWINRTSNHHPLLILSNVKDWIFTIDNIIFQFYPFVHSVFLLHFSPFHPILSLVPVSSSFPVFLLTPPSMFFTLSLQPFPPLCVFV